MVFSYYLFKIPYSICWNFLKSINKLKKVVFYCGDPLDYFVFHPVEIYLENILYVTDKPEVKNFLFERGIPFASMPVFPIAVIMARHSTHKFPVKSIIKIGLRHGAYHFKRMTSAANYNQFDLYLMTSVADVEAGSKLGITCAKAVGFPKLDAAFNDAYDQYYLVNLRNRLSFVKSRPTILFTATYDTSGMSGIEIWFKQLSELRAKYNIMVTLHPWVDIKYKKTIESTLNVYLIKEYNAIPYIVLADIVVGDNSSILAECCALNKPMITFSTGIANRTLDEIEILLSSISYRIHSFNELQKQIEHALANPDELKPQRDAANMLMFDSLDGKAGQRAAQQIKQLLIASD